MSYLYAGTIRNWQGMAQLTTELTVYTDDAGTIPASLTDVNGDAIANPVTTDDRGRIEVYGTPALLWYKVTGDDRVMRLLRFCDLVEADVIGSSAAFANVRTYGAVGSGVVDDSAAVIAALAAVSSAGGGTLYFPAGTYRIDSQLLMPAELCGNGVDNRQAPVVLRGDGCKQVLGLDAADMLGGTTLDLRYVGAGGKISSPGYGRLGIENLHLTQAVSAADATPFVLSVLTTTTIRRVSVEGYATLSGETCIQDAFQFGNASPGRIFEGYGSSGSDCLFGRIRSGIVLHRGCNSMRFSNLMWATTCGSNGNNGAIDIDGTADQARVNHFDNMVIESMGYTYPLRMKNACDNIFTNPSFWDSDATMVACVKLEGASDGNLLINPLHFAQAGEWPYQRRWVSDGTSRPMWLAGNEVDGQKFIVAGGWSHGGAGDRCFGISPEGPPADGAAHRMFCVNRSQAEATDPSGEVVAIHYNGDASFKGGVSAAGGYTVGNDGLVKYLGNLELYSASGNLILSSEEGHLVSIGRGILGLPPVATVNRPPASLGEGACYYDTTLNKPGFSDGTVWRDAAGTAI